MEIKIISPSYKRPEKSITQTNYPGIDLVVMESEVEAYEANGNRVVSCPDKIQGNVCRVRNWILDKYLKDFDCVVIIDDDCSYIGRWNEQEVQKFNQEELEEFCEMGTILCKEYGFLLWGLNCVIDKGAYREYSPFGTLQYLGAPFQAHMKGSLIRYDEKLPLKEDYDITLQHIKMHGGCLRLNFAHYSVKQAQQVGGCATYRNTEYEMEQLKDLQIKWGKDVVCRDQGSKRKFDFNPILRVPVKGI